MLEKRAAPSLTQWIKWMSTPLPTACVCSWQLFGRGMLGKAAFLPPDLKQSGGHSHPTKSVEKQRVLSSAPSSPCSPNPDTSERMAGSLRAELRLRGACFIHHLTRFIFHKRHRCARISTQSLSLFTHFNVIFGMFFFTCAVGRLSLLCTNILSTNQYMF